MICGGGHVPLIVRLHGVAGPPPCRQLSMEQGGAEAGETAGSCREGLLLCEGGGYLEWGVTPTISRHRTSLLGGEVCGQGRNVARGLHPECTPHCGDSSRGSPIEWGSPSPLPPVQVAGPQAQAGSQGCQGWHMPVLPSLAASSLSLISTCQREARFAGNREFAKSRLWNQKATVPLSATLSPSFFPLLDPF